MKYVSFSVYQILHPRHRCAIMCQNGAKFGMQYRVDSGPIAAQCGLFTWIWLNQNNISNHANTQFTHLWHICHKKLIHCSKWLASIIMHCLSPELAYLKHGNTKKIHFQEIKNRGKWQSTVRYCNSNPDVHWTMSTIPIIWDYYYDYTVASAILDNYHNANFGSQQWFRRWLSGTIRGPFY